MTIEQLAEKKFKVQMNFKKVNTGYTDEDVLTNMEIGYKYSEGYLLMSMSQNYLMTDRMWHMIISKSILGSLRDYPTPCLDANADAEMYCKFKWEEIILEGYVCFFISKSGYYVTFNKNPLGVMKNDVMGTSKKLLADLLEQSDCYIYVSQTGKIELKLVSGVLKSCCFVRKDLQDVLQIVLLNTIRVYSSGISEFVGRAIGKYLFNNTDELTVKELIVSVLPGCNNDMDKAILRLKGRKYSDKEILDSLVRYFKEQRELWEI